MHTVIKTVSGSVTITAGEQGVAPGAVKVSFGPFFNFTLTADEAARIGAVASAAARIANEAKAAA